MHDRATALARSAGMLRGRVKPSTSHTASNLGPWYSAVGALPVMRAPGRRPGTRLCQRRRPFRRRRGLIGRCGRRIRPGRPQRRQPGRGRRRNRGERRAASRSIRRASTRIGQRCGSRRRPRPPRRARRRKRRRSGMRAAGEALQAFLGKYRAEQIARAAQGSTNTSGLPENLGGKGGQATYPNGTRLVIIGTTCYLNGFQLPAHIGTGTCDSLAPVQPASHHLRRRQRTRQRHRRPPRRRGQPR